MNRTLENELSNIRWFRATTDRMLESSFSRVQFVYLVQGNDWSNVGKLIFKSSIHLLGSGQRLIERWKARFQEFDSFSWFRATTDRMLESSFSRVRFIYLVQGKDWSNVGELIFKSSIRFLQSLPWTKKTNRTLENELSNIRSVVALNQENESNSWKWAFQHSISRCPEPRKRIELLKMSFPTFDQSLPWTKKTNRTLENELSNIRSVVALNQENESNSWKWAFQHSMVQGNDWSNVGKLVFKSSIRFLGSGQRLIECWKAHFQEFDSFSWFRATTDRMLESSFSRVRFVLLVQGKDRSNVGKLIFKSSIRLLGSGQRLIECWKAHFQEFDSFTWFRATTSRQRVIERWKARFQEFDSFSSVVALNQENESNSWKRAFQHSISRCPEPSKWIELLKMSFPTFDQSLPWTKKTNRTLENELSNARWFRATTDRMLESSFSRVRFIYLVQGNDWSSVGKLIFKSSIRFLGSGQRLIECWKARFQEFDSFTWFRARTDRMLESSFSRVRFVSFSRCPEPRKRIELLKMSFPTFDQSLPWTKKTNRTLENELSNIRSVVALNQENESNSWKWAFQHSISRCPEPRKRIELLKTSFPTFDQSLPWTKKTNRTLENELSNIRSVVALNQENESNSWKRAFQHSISRCPEPSKRIELLKMSFPTFDGSGQRLIECWKARFQEFDSFSWFRATTDRMLESSFSRVRFVCLVQGNDWSNVGKLIFKSSIRLLGSGQRLQGNEWSSVGKLVFKSSIRFLQSLPWTKKTNRTLENELSNIRSVVALNQENESNSWKWAFQHSISRCPEPRKRIELLKMSFPTFDGSGQRLIECWKAHFQEFDSFSWFRATTDRMLESSFSRVRFVFLVQGNDWSSVGKLVFKSSIRFLGSGQGLIECWKARFQEFDSFSWFRARTDRAVESSFSRVQFVYFSRCPEPSKRIELLKMSFPTLDQSLPWTKKTNQTLENELSNIRSVVALNQVNELNSWKWAFQHSMVQGNDWSNVGKLIFKSLIRFLGSGQRLIECWKAHFQEFNSFTWFRATTDRMLESSFSRVRFIYLVQGKDWSNVGELIFKSSIRFLGSGQGLIECWKARFKSSIHLLGSGQRLIECWRAHFQEFDSFPSVVALNQENESNSWKWAFQHSISRCPEPRKRIELLKMSFPTFDQSLPWTKKTNRTLENELSNIRSVVALNQENESNSWKRAFQHSISRCPEPRKRIELLKMSFPTFDQSLPWTKKTNRTLENELSNIRSVVALNQVNESNSWKWAFQRSISPCPEPRKRIELLKTSFPTFDQSLPWTKKTNRTLENELSNTRSVLAWTKKTNRTLENELSNIRSVVALNQENESNSWKRAFQHSISRCPEPSKRIELLKTSFPTFDQSLPWTKKTNRTLENWAFQHSISRCPEPSKRIELLKTSFPTFDQSLPWTKKTNRTLENELSNIRSVVALNQENESNSWKWAFQRSISRCPEPSKRIELLKMSFPTFDQSLPWTKKTNRTLENELSNIRSVVALNQENESNSWKWAFQHSISRCPEPRKRIELLKTSFPTFDQSLPWTKKTNRTLENELSNIRSVVALNQENESNSWKWAFQHSISRCSEPRKRIELLKMSFPTFDQSLPWTKKTNRTLENELSNIRSVVALNQENESNSWKRAFQHSISRCPEPRKRIELLKMSFPTFDQSLPWTK